MKHSDLKTVAMKVTLVLFAVVLFTDAAMASDENFDSPLVSYLLAKVE